MTHTQEIITHRVLKIHAGVGVGWVMQGWDGSCRGRVGHTGLGWVMHGLDVVGHIRVG